MRIGEYEFAIQYIVRLTAILFLVIVDKVIMATMITNHRGKSDFLNSRNKTIFLKNNLNARI